ncbi:HNH endonuclease signature motif containing protein [Leptospira kanakyensis]|uniref:HNH endonuclease signature motif containing protein n=1 Tax=Leptospira kanakyensis TaxID=2484968 RepID=UPI00223E2E85|nr:HNH endonuclease signature motif containing protein [Leptospira kanakyensis]MCW7483234.1 HNH endonuclease [Leptospira kanakyensis]
MIIKIIKLLFLLIKYGIIALFYLIRISINIIKWIFNEEIGKTYIDKNGYRRFKDSDMPVHRWVAENFIRNGKLQDGEVVHHKNRNKLDNSPENLYIFKNQKEHDRVHKIDAKRFGKKNSYKGFNS